MAKFRVGDEVTFTYTGIVRRIRDKWGKAYYDFGDDEVYEHTMIDPQLVLPEPEPGDVCAFSDGQYVTIGVLKHYILGADYPYVNWDNAPYRTARKITDLDQIKAVLSNE